ncbi:MAG: hypothetical protein AB9836_00840 [Aminipila sp.]
MKSYIYLKSISDDGLRTLYKQAKEYDIKQSKEKILFIPSEDFPELRSFVLKSYYLEDDEKFCSLVARTMLKANIIDEIIRRFMEA